MLQSTSDCSAEEADDDPSARFSSPPLSSPFPPPPHSHRAAARSSRCRRCAPMSRFQPTSCGSAISSTTPARQARLPVFRAPDLGTTGTRAGRAGARRAARAASDRRRHARSDATSSVTRAARVVERPKDIAGAASPRALSAATRLGDAANLAVTFDRDTRRCCSSTPPIGRAARRSPCATSHRNSRFDVTFEIANDDGAAPAQLRFTGIADRDRRSRRADAQRRPRRSAQSVRSRDRAPAEGREPAPTSCRATTRSACRRRRAIARRPAAARTPTSPSPTSCSATRT